MIKLMGKIGKIMSVFLAVVMMFSAGVYSVGAESEHAAQNTSTGDTYDSLKAAVEEASEGDTIEVLSDTEVNDYIEIRRNVTVEATGKTVTGAQFWYFTNTAELTLIGGTYNGNGTALNLVWTPSLVKPSSYSGKLSKYQNANSGTIVTLNGLTVKNYVGDSDCIGAVYLFGKATGVLSDCTFVNNTTSGTDGDGLKGSDVYTGSSTTVTVTGCSLGGSIFVSGGSAQLTAENSAIDSLEVHNNSESTDISVINSTIHKVRLAGGNKDKQITFDSSSDVATPLGFEFRDNGDGTKTVVFDSNPLNRLRMLASAVYDDNSFDLNVDYLSGSLLGAQKKNAVEGAAKTSIDGAQETGNDIRFVAVLDKELIDRASDYGFVLAKVSNTSKTTENSNLDALDISGGNGQKAISALGSYNNVCGNSAYGDPFDASTDYKYITCAVNGVDSGKVAARFYITIDGKTYYAKYAKDNYEGGYTGMVAGMNDLVNE